MRQPPDDSSAEQLHGFAVYTLAETNEMLFALGSAPSVAVLAARNVDAEILGVIDLTNNAEAQIGTISLGQAIQFVANASVLGYDVRAAMVRYGELGTPSLRVGDCEQLWSQFGSALLEPDIT